jgi:ADP-heptose:LPS heptosyltransferase
LKSEAGSSPNNTETPFDWSRVQRVLLVRLRSIGDTVLMTPCLAALKAWRPDLEIAVVSEQLAAPLLEGHPLVDELIIAKQPVRSRASLIARLRNARFDVAFNMHGGSTGTILARLSGARHSAGYRGLPLSWLLSDRAPSPDVILGRSRIHSVEQQLALLNWSGVPLPESRPRLSLLVRSEITARLRARLRTLGGPAWNEAVAAVAGGFGCIVPGAAFESKRWTTEGFAAVADHLSERWNLPSVVIAGQGQEGLARAVASATRARSPVLDGLSLKELAALLEMARVFVGNDSGPMHIAAALGRPVVAVWGSSDSTVWHPWTETPWRVVDGGRSMVDGRRPAITQIRASEVIAAVDEVLEPALEANHKADHRPVTLEGGTDA